MRFISRVVDLLFSNNAITSIYFMFRSMQFYQCFCIGHQCKFWLCMYQVLLCFYIIPLFPFLFFWYEGFEQLFNKGYFALYIVFACTFCSGSHCPHSLQICNNPYMLHVPVYLLKRSFRSPTTTKKKFTKQIKPKICVSSHFLLRTAYTGYGVYFYMSISEIVPNTAFIHTESMVARFCCILHKQLEFADAPFRTVITKGKWPFSEGLTISALLKIIVWTKKYVRDGNCHTIFPFKCWLH